MGVMSCSRPDCESIMCDTYVNGVGYVCPSCQEEFKEYAVEKDLDVSTEGQIKKELLEFMKTDKGSHSKGKEMDIDDFFDQYNKYD